MKTILITIGLILGGQLLHAQDSIPPMPRLGCCVKTKSLTLTDLKKTHPFDKTNKIQVVSFKPDLTNESPPTKDGTIDTTQFIETKTLNRKEENGLIDILYNYNFDPKVNKDSIVLEVMMCYEPRNAVIFRNKSNEIITWLEICFECLRAYSQRNDLHIVFCQDKYDRLKNYFGQLGIKFGVTEKEE